jgi:hypothetical protein
VISQRSGIVNAAVHAHAPSRAIEVSGVADKYNAAMTKTVQASLVQGVIVAAENLCIGGSRRDACNMRPGDVIA